MVLCDSGVVQLAEWLANLFYFLSWVPFETHCPFSTVLTAYVSLWNSKCVSNNIHVAQISFLRILFSVQDTDGPVRDILVQHGERLNPPHPAQR